MRLHVDSLGSGSPLVLLHGWGMHGGIWSRVAAQLAQHHQVHCVDLPGYGASDCLAQYNLDAVVQALVGCFREPVNVCGWSLGGQVALRWAHLFPAQVKKLVLVASTPCFVQRDGWSSAMAADTLEEFAAGLLHNPAQTLRRFVTLQIRGSDHERELLAELRAILFSRGEPHARALSAGLEILRDTDLRNHLAQIAQRALIIAGEQDRLTPLAASVYLASQMPNGQLVTIKGAAHIPFLSHSDIFVAQVMSFL